MCDCSRIGMCVIALHGMGDYTGGSVCECTRTYVISLECV